MKLRLKHNGKPSALVLSDKPMLRAAIYCRKSTDDARKDEELRSTAKQEANARKYAEKQGWRVLEDHIYKDADSSGGLISRPAFDRMKAALGIVDGTPLRRAPDPSSLPFDVIVTRKQNRLTRRDDALRQLKQFLRTGVKLAYYQTGEVLDSSNFRSIHAGVEGLVDSDAREEAKRLVWEGQEKYAHAGHVCGGVCYGYDLKPIMGKSASGQLIRLHTDSEKNPEQAGVIVRIFKMFVACHGPRVIAKTMNGDPRYSKLSRQFFDGKRPPKPKQGKRGSGSWAPSALRDMVRNERYAGVLIWGRVHTQEDEDGKPYRIRQLAEKIVRTERSDLRIVPPDLWAAAQKRINAVKQSYVRNKDGTLPWGRPESGRHSRYLLSGLARCGLCGAALIAHKMTVGSNGTRRLVSHYVCSFNNKRGNTICSNNWRKRLDELDDKVLGMIEREVLTPERVRKALALAKAAVRERARKDPDAKKKLEAQIKDLKSEWDNIYALSRQRLDDPKRVADDLNECSRRIRALEAELASLGDGGSDPRKLAATEAWLMERIGKFRELMKDRRNAEPARTVLRKALKEPLRCIPIVRDGRKDYAIARNAFLLRREQVATPRGFEPRLPP